jgi:prepilin-type N-terminal cleavage/methylation domain-containing protein
MLKKINNGFTLIELLVVLVLAGIITVFAYPNVSSWLTERELRNGVYDFVAYVSKMKSEVVNNRYSMWQITWPARMDGIPVAETAFMTNQNFMDECKRATSTNACRAQNRCNPWATQRGWTRADAFTIRNARKPMGTTPTMCVSKDGTVSSQINDETDPATGQQVERLILCHHSVAACDFAGTADNRYKVTWDHFLNLKVYKYRVPTNTWVIHDG